MVALTIPMNHDDDDDDIHSHGCDAHISKTGCLAKIDFDERQTILWISEKQI